jgi:catechol 2,3-dioxygenase-like lactoylglutathione lyase family enzyme
MEKSPFSRVQIGVIVKDINQAVKYYESLGIGPFKSVFEETGINLVIKDRMLYDEPADDIKALIKVAQMGPVQFEVIQPTADSGKSLPIEFLKEHGEGINHLGFFVDDIAKETSKLVEKGVKVIQSGKFERGGGFAFFETRPSGRFLIELIQYPPPSE